MAEWRASQGQVSDLDQRLRDAVYAAVERYNEDEGEFATVQRQLSTPARCPH